MKKKHLGYLLKGVYLYGLFILNLPDILYIKISGRFDTGLYITKYKLKKYKLFPIFHYIIIGEKLGYQPSEYFDPLVYQGQYPMLRGGYFVHYLEHNKGKVYIKTPESFEQIQNELPKIVASKPKSRIAVVFHVFYPDVIDEIFDQLDKIPESYDLILTVTNNNAQSTIDKIKQRYTYAQIYCYPNHGRDIFPFFDLLNKGLLDGYVAICKVHTKKSLHRGFKGAYWRRALLDGILNNGNVISKIINTILKGDIGIVVSNGQLIAFDEINDRNAKVIKKLSEQFAITYRDFKFPQGSMFWASAQLVVAMKTLCIKPEDFNLESGQIDGEMHHALERMFGLIAVSNGLALLEVKQVDMF